MASIEQWRCNKHQYIGRKCHSYFMVCKKKKPLEQHNHKAPHTPQQLDISWSAVSFWIETSRARGQGCTFQPFQFSEKGKGKRGKKEKAESRKEKKIQAIPVQPFDSMLGYPVLLLQSHTPHGLCYFLLQWDNFGFHADLHIKAKNLVNPGSPVTLIFCGIINTVQSQSVINIDTYWIK